MCEDPIGFWINRPDVESRAAYESQFGRWMPWLHRCLGWENTTLRELLMSQHHLRMSTSSLTRQSSSDGYPDGCEQRSGCFDMLDQPVAATPSPWGGGGDRKQVSVTKVSFIEPTLEDVFISETGRSLRD